MYPPLARLRSHALRVGLGLVWLGALIGATLGVWPVDALNRLEHYAYDVRLRATLHAQPDTRVVIVDIDEASLHQLGHWPWPRPTLARLVDSLFDRYHVRVLGFDVLFAERDNSSGLATLQALAQGPLKDDAAFQAQLHSLRPTLQFDARLARALRDRPVVLGYFLQHGRADPRHPLRLGQLPAPVRSAGSFDAAQVGAAVASAYTANLPELQAAAAAGGFFNATPLIDTDGVLRRMSLLQNWDGALYESLALAVARLALHAPPPELVYAGGRSDAVALEALSLGGRRVPIDADLAAYIPYRGPQGSFPYVSAADVLAGRADAQLLQGAIVLVGSTAAGLLDLRATPVQEVYPGVEVHANLIAGMLDDRLLQRPPYVRGLELVLLLGVGGLLALGLPGRTPMQISVLSAAVAALSVALNVLLWRQAQLIAPLASGLVLIAGLFLLNMSFGFFSDARTKRHITRLFGQYIPPELVHEMAQNPGRYSLAGESRRMSVLFSDVRGFTSLSEGLPAQQLAALMNAFLTPMTRVIHAQRGTIDKYMGDAIMAFWGAPLADPAHASHAVAAALGMVATLDELAPSFRAKGWPAIHIGVGVNSGEMTVGNMGSAFRLAYTVMGDAVNLGSRLEGLTKHYGVPIIVSEYTALAAPEYAYRELDCVRVQGKDRAVRIFEPLGRADSLPADLRQGLAQNAQALQAYRARDWAGARALFAALAAQEPGVHVHHLYLARIDAFERQAPPADWDGCYTHTDK